MNNWDNFYIKKGEELLRLYPGISFEDFKHEMTHIKYYKEATYQLSEMQMWNLWKENNDGKKKRKK